MLLLFSLPSESLDYKCFPSATEFSFVLFKMSYYYVIQDNFKVTVLLPLTPDFCHYKRMHQTSPAHDAFDAFVSVCFLIKSVALQARLASRSFTLCCLTCLQLTVLRPQAFKCWACRYVSPYWALIQHFLMSSSFCRQNSPTSPSLHFLSVL